MAGARDVLREVTIPDAGIDQIVHGTAGLERFPRTPPAGIERNDRAIGSDHHQLTRRRQSHTI